MIEPHFEYIDENLNKIIQNPDSILYLRPDAVRKKQALFAMVKEEQGIYKNVQVTREQSKMTFPWEPIYYFYKGPGYLFLKKYIILHNWIALNTTNLDGFKFKRLDDFKGFVGIFATFNDGSATFVRRQKEKEFQRQGGIESYINLLRQHKEYDPQHENYQIIECYNNDDNTFIIPELQSKIENQSKVRTLSIDNKRI